MTASYLSSEGARILLPFVTILFAGNINKAHLDGVGLANTLFNIVVLSLSQGYSYVFDTFGPQVYSSSKPEELTTCLIKCLLQGGMLHLILLGPFLNLVYLIDMLPSSGVYPTLDQDRKFEVQDFRDIAVTYLRLTVPVEFLDYAMVLICTYFIILGRTKLVYLVSVIMTAAHILANYIFVSVLGLGVKGLAVAAISGRFLALAVSLGICVVNIKRGSFPWAGISLNVLAGWKTMIMPGVSGAVFVFIKILLTEISTFFSQFVNMDTLSAVVILFQIFCVLVSVVIAIAHTSSNLIGKALAQESTSDVKQYMTLTVINIFLEVVPGTIICYFWRGSIVRMFTDDPEVIDLFCKVFWLVCVFFVLSHLQVGINQRILTAFGEQAYTAINMTWSCLFVGLPIVISTIFLTDLGLTGIILGWTATKVILLVTGLVKVWRTDVSGEIGKSRLRVEKSTYGSLDTRESEERLKNTYDESGRTSKESKLDTESEGTGTKHTSDGGAVLNVDDTVVKRSADVTGFHREVKSVVLTLSLTAVLFLTLVGVSFLRDVYKDGQ